MKGLEMKALNLREVFTRLMDGHKVIDGERENVYWMDSNDKICSCGTSTISNVNRIVYLISNLPLEKNYYDFDPSKKPELYWQWRILTDKHGELHQLMNSSALLSEENLISYTDIKNVEKHAGPWILTEDGFKKHETWSQY